MSYGLKVINNSNYVQIDSDTPRLCALYNGTYTASNSHVVTTNFPAPITTTEPPCVFIRNDPARPNEVYYRMDINGSAGNWTGFSITAGNNTFRPAGKWFAAVFASLAKATYGLRIWGPSGAICYDSGATPVIVTRANHSWSYQGSVSLSTIGQAYYYRNEQHAALATDEYFMINPFSRGVLKPQSLNWMDCGIRFNYSENRLQLYMVDTGAGPWIDQGAPAAVFARLPGT